MTSSHEVALRFRKVGDSWSGASICKLFVSIVSVLCQFKHIAAKDVVITLLHFDDPVSPLLPAMHCKSSTQTCHLTE